MGKAHINYSTKPDWWDEDKVTFSRDYSIAGKMNKPHLVKMIESAYKYHVTDSTGVHIERSVSDFETAIVDKQVLLSRLLSEIVAGVQERGENFEQEPVTNECTHGRKEKLPASGKKKGIDRNSDKVEITDADVVALVVSLSSLSTINRYLLPNNIQGQSVYILETLTVASSGSQNSWNQFLVPVPNPISSTRIVPESKSDTDFQGVPHPAVHNIEPMGIELSHTGPQDIQVPSMSSGNQVHVARVRSDHDITVPLEIHSVTDYNQHTHSPSITYGNQISVKESSTVHDVVAPSFHFPSDTQYT